MNRGWSISHSELEGHEGGYDQSRTKIDFHRSGSRIKTQHTLFNSYQINATSRTALTHSEAVVGCTRTAVMVINHNQKTNCFSTPLCSDV
ncbi:hypothetical protein J6590_038016 [Homalodisca vitripennis]|nr:hypothetical protein J6590_038016 [Homalodisca vitripennis]